MTSTLTITLDRASMDALLRRAGRTPPENALENDALQDAHAQIDRADATVAREKSDADPEQLALFDASEYDA